MLNNSKVNYIVVNRDNIDYIARVIEEPTYKKVELDPSNAYSLAFLPDNMNKKDYPGLFNIENTEIKYYKPFRKVMCHIGKCDFCDKIVGPESIIQEYTDLYNKLGYFYCFNCKDVFEESLKRSGIRSIWYLRNRQTKENKYNIWVPRTRRDENGKKITYGPYKFEKWSIFGWYAYDYEDENGVTKPHVICDNGILNKLVPVDIIMEINPENNPDYDPNNDPKWL